MRPLVTEENIGTTSVSSSGCHYMSIIKEKDLCNIAEYLSHSGKVEEHGGVEDFISSAFQNWSFTAMQQDTESIKR